MLTRAQLKPDQFLRVALETINDDESIVQLQIGKIQRTYERAEQLIRVDFMKRFATKNANVQLSSPTFILPRQSTSFLMMSMSVINHTGQSQVARAALYNVMIVEMEPE